MKTLFSQKIPGIFDAESKYVFMSPLEAGGAKESTSEKSESRVSAEEYETKKKLAETELKQENSQEIESIDAELEAVLAEDSRSHYEKIKEDRPHGEVSPKTLSAYEKYLWENNPHLQGEKGDRIWNAYRIDPKNAEMLYITDREFLVEKHARSLEQTVYKDFLDGFFVEEYGEKDIPPEDVQKILTSSEAKEFLKKWIIAKFVKRMKYLEEGAKKSKESEAAKEIKALKIIGSLVNQSDFNPYERYIDNLDFYQASQAVFAKKTSLKRALLVSYRYGNDEYGEGPYNFDDRKTAYGERSIAERSDFIGVAEKGSQITAEEMSFIQNQPVMSMDR